MKTTPLVGMASPRAILALALIAITLPAIRASAQDPGDMADAESSAGTYEHEAAAPALGFGTYLDAGVLVSTTQPDNNRWRSKGSSYILDQAKINNFTLWMDKAATTESRWGFQLGAQAGVDVDGGEPDASEAIGGADVLKHLYYSHLEYLFDLGRGLDVKAGLLPSFMGYSSFHAIDNPTYTRPYAADYVPYFTWGAQAELPFSGVTMASLYLTSGWDYLKDVNDSPSYGGRFQWRFARDWELITNFWYGPEQANTAADYWRFANETNVEWSNEDFLVAGSVTHGSERSATLPGEPRTQWTALVLWLKWKASSSWNLALRPEYFDDPDGMQTGYRQTIKSISLTAEYRLFWHESHEPMLRTEYRYDNSTGEQGGFFEGDENRLTPDQHLFIVSLLWRFGTP